MSAMPRPSRRRTYFVTRKFPPSVGGMETLAAGVWRTLHAAEPDAELIAFGGQNRGLVRWLPAVVVKVVRLALQGRLGFVLTGDAVMCTVLAPVLRAARVPHATMVMGLDLTFDHPAYRAVVHPVLRRTPCVIAISEATAETARGFGIAADRVQVVRLGVSAPEVGPAAGREARRELGARLGVGEDAVLMLTLGRLVRRKGVRWLVEQVLPQLPPQVHYVVAGDGPEAEPLRSAVAAGGLGGRVHLLGAVDDADRELLLQGADLFVQPNIPVPHDMEGFGLVTIEAGLRGTPVVAAELEGIKDAVADGVTGVLLPPGDAPTWTARLTDLVADPPTLAARGAAFAEAARARYGEEVMGRQLVAALAAAEVRGRHPGS